MWLSEAEGEGFEPSRDEAAPNGFRDRRIRPLCHPSGGIGHPNLTLPAGKCESGEGGIRTLEAGYSPPNALAGRRLQPLGHFSVGGHGNNATLPELLRPPAPESEPEKGQGPRGRVGPCQSPGLGDVLRTQSIVWLGSGPDAQIE